MRKCRIVFEIVADDVEASYKVQIEGDLKPMDMLQFYLACAKAFTQAIDKKKKLKQQNRRPRR